MPSPIAHLAAGFVIYKVFGRYVQPASRSKSDPAPALLLALIALSFFPDMDSLVGLLTGNFGRYHNNLTHSLLVVLAVAFVAGLIGSRVGWGRFWPLFAVAALAYGTHVMMDAVTIGRGVMALWPFTDTRYLSPVTLFYGFHWSDGLVSSRHIITLVTESLFAAAVVLLARRYAPAVRCPRDGSMVIL